MSKADIEKTADALLRIVELLCDQHATETENKHVVRAIVTRLRILIKRIHTLKDHTVKKCLFDRLYNIVELANKYSDNKYAIDFQPIRNLMRATSYRRKSVEVVSKMQLEQNISYESFLSGIADNPTTITHNDGTLIKLGQQ
jgi:hypothetical protein